MQAIAKIQEIYIGLLGRAADQDGLNYWVGEYSKGSLSYDQIRGNLVNSQAEYASGLGSMDRASAVSELYQRFFHRAPETDGFNYWTSGGGSGVPFDQLVLALANGAGDEDRQILNNKIDVADYYTNNYIYKKSDAELVISEVSTDASLEAIKYANESLSGAFNLNAKNFSVSGISQPINFGLTPGAVGTPSETNFQTITGIQGYGETYNTGDASIVTNDIASPGIAAISLAGLATFSSADRTLAQHLIAVEMGIATGGEAAAGQGAMWQEGNDTFLFISDGVDGLTENDNLVKLVGVDTSDPDFDYLIDIGSMFAIA
jgi:hypothetical protein